MSSTPSQNSQTPPENRPKWKSSYYSGTGIGEHVLEAEKRVRVVGDRGFDATVIYIIQSGSQGLYYLKRESDGRPVEDPVDGEILQRVE